MLTAIRFILGKLILFLNWAFPPKSITRDPDQQALIDGQTANLTLYQYRACLTMAKSAPSGQAVLLIGHNELDCVGV